MTLIDKLRRRVVGGIFMNRRVMINGTKWTLGKLIFGDKPNLILHADKRVELAPNVKEMLDDELVKEVEEYLTERVKRIKTK